MFADKGGGGGCWNNAYEIHKIPFFSKICFKFEKNNLIPTNEFGKRNKIWQNKIKFEKYFIAIKP